MKSCARSDCVVIVTDHTEMDYQRVCQFMFADCGHAQRAQRRRQAGQHCANRKVVSQRFKVQVSKVKIRRPDVWTLRLWTSNLCE